MCTELQMILQSPIRRGLYTRLLQIRVKMVETLLPIGVLSQNEIGRLFGFAPVKGGDMGMWMSMCNPADGTVGD